MPEMYLRSFVLDDIHISRSQSADGREVTAYAAIFDLPYEVSDQYGHYMETIERSAFNRTLSHGLSKTMCLYNHGMDLRGKPDALASVPIGKPLDIKPDSRGLLTITRYNHSALADATLEAIRNGDITSQSFRGGIYRSSHKGRVPAAKPGQPLPVVTRHELGLSDYGPTPIPVNNTQMVVAVRSVIELAEDFAALDEAQRADLIRLASTTPQVTETRTATSTTEPGAEDPHPDAVHSGRLAIARARIAVERIKMGALNGKAQNLSGNRR